MHSIHSLLFSLSRAVRAGPASTPIFRAGERQRATITSIAPFCGLCESYVSKRERARAKQRGSRAGSGRLRSFERALPHPPPELVLALAPRSLCFLCGVCCTSSTSVHNRALAARTRRGITGLWPPPRPGAFPRRRASRATLLSPSPASAPFLFLAGSHAAEQPGASPPAAVTSGRLGAVFACAPAAWPGPPRALRLGVPRPRLDFPLRR